ncbi:MAG: hypothetical protein AMXMBFR64_34020 [Myxococcales bacterium]
MKQNTKQGAKAAQSPKNLAGLGMPAWLQPLASSSFAQGQTLTCPAGPTAGAPLLQPGTQAGFAGGGLGGGGGKGLGGAPKPVSRPVLLERMAHTYAYEKQVSTEDAAALADAGYVASAPERGSAGFAMMRFVPTRPDAGPPVLALRGTHVTDVKDILADTSPEGVGIYAFFANEGLIATALADLQAHGRPEVCGHSLGGALAQLTAALYPGYVSHVTTFQSPGIPPKYRQILETWNKKTVASGGAPVLSDHHVVAGDAVTGNVGEALTPGTLHTWTKKEPQKGPMSPLLAPSITGTLIDAVVDPVKLHTTHPVEEHATGGDWTETQADSSSWKGSSVKEFTRILGGSVYHLFDLDEDAYMSGYPPLRDRLVRGEALDSVLKDVPSLLADKGVEQRIADNLAALSKVLNKPAGLAGSSGPQMCLALDVTTRGGFLATLSKRYGLKQVASESPEAAVKTAKAAGLLQQERPHDTLTRAESAAILTRIFGLDWSAAEKQTAYFADLVEGTWQFDVAHACRRWGIYLGTKENRFEADRAMTPGEAGIVLDRIGARKKLTFAEQSAHLAVPALREPSKVEAMLSGKDLTPAQIATLREQIKSLPKEQRPDAYRRLNALVAYRNQRNNAGGVTIPDWMCNVTSLAMVLEGLGVAQDGPGQHEDTLANRHRDAGMKGTIFDEAGQNAIAKDKGVTGERKSYTGARTAAGAKAWFHEHVLPRFEEGAQATMSITAWGDGHIVRVQWVEDRGVLVDDPYGGVQKSKAGGFDGYGKTANSTSKERGDGTFGEDNLWTWDFLAREVRYVHFFTK